MGSIRLFDMAILERLREHWEQFCAVAEGNEDIDRLIDGEFELGEGELQEFFHSKELAATVIMRHYDGGQWASTARSYSDAFYSEGTNAAQKWESETA